MRYSQVFGKTLRDAPKDEESINAKLLIRGGFIAKEIAGVYTFLPLGWRVLSKIEDIVRQEMDTIGAQEMLLPALHAKEHWEKTRRWNALDILFRLESRHGHAYALGPTHEEVLSPLAVHFIQSYRDLPMAVYQIQTKYRDEPRAKSGILRGREFRMKDLYSFHASKEDLETYYERVVTAYKNIFQRLTLDASLTEASGGTFSKYSHEFQVKTPSGEDVIFLCTSCGFSRNREVIGNSLVSASVGTTHACPSCRKKSLQVERASEVGNIFKLGTKFSLPFHLTFLDEDGATKPVIMGCYGIGTSRVMGTVVEVFHDEKGIIWPDVIAPFQVHLVGLDREETSAEKRAEEIYRKLTGQGIDVLYDDRDERAGVKFADADLIGVPIRLVVSKKTGERIERKRRSESSTTLVPVQKIVEERRQNI